MGCRCHSAPGLYGSLVRCPSCAHTSYDPYAESCERRTCGYETSVTGPAGGAARAEASL